MFINFSFFGNDIMSNKPLFTPMTELIVEKAWPKDRHNRSRIAAKWSARFAGMRPYIQLFNNGSRLYK